MTGLGFDITNPRQLRKLMSDPSNLADLLTEKHDETDDSPAEIFADLINVMRADQVRLAAAVGVDLDVQRMTPERAAQLLAGTVGGDGVELVKMFNQEAENRDKILRELLDEDEHEDFMERKHASMFTREE